MERFSNKKLRDSLKKIKSVLWGPLAPQGLNKSVISTPVTGNKERKQLYSKLLLSSSKLQSNKSLDFE